MDHRCLASNDEDSVLASLLPPPLLEREETSITGAHQQHGLSQSRQQRAAEAPEAGTATTASSDAVLSDFGGSGSGSTATNADVVALFRDLTTQFQAQFKKSFYDGKTFSG